MARPRLVAEWLFILALALGIAAWSALSGTTARFDLPLLDWISARGVTPASDDIVVVAIDDRSLAEIGQWPWDRSREAQLIDRLSATRPRLIQLDVLMAEPTAPSADAALAASIGRAGNIILPHAFTNAEGRADGLDPVEPLPTLAGRAAAVGHVSLRPDSDGVIRHVELEVREGAARYPQLQLAAYRLMNRADPAELHRAVPSFVPLRAAGAYRTVSAAAVLRGEVPAGFFTGRIVLIGATAAGLGDVHPVPASAGSLIAGIELQANLLQALQEDSFIIPAAPRMAAALSCLPVLLLFAGFLRLRPAGSLALVMAIAVVTVAASVALALLRHWWLPPGPALLALALAWPLWGWRRLQGISTYLLQRAERLDPTAPPTRSGGFDSLAREVSRLDSLVDHVNERRGFLLAVLESTPDAMCAFAADGGLLLMNARARALFGRDDPGLSLNDMLLQIGARSAGQDDEFTLGDGRVLAISRSTAADSGEWGGLRIAVLADVTEARQAEAERRRMLEFLSHDMRAPQVAILGLTGLEDPAVSPEARLHRIRGHARRTLHLADTFVQLARLNDAPLARDDIDVAMLIEEAADRAHGTAKSAAVLLTASIKDDLPRISGDGQILSRMLDNLIGNALRYCEAGCEVVLTAEDDGQGAVVLGIADNGPGLPPERISDPFQSFGSSDGGSGGVGLGLAFVAAAVKRHDGQITCESAPGKGTRFRIVLPASDD
ncbi:MAG: CHASE2 domain-containing protein [Novosphingobium sp.]